MKHLGIDVDGVCADFSSKFVELANKRYGTNHSTLDQHNWEFEPWFTKAQVGHVWDQDIKPSPNFWQSLRPLPGTDKLKRLPKDVEPIFITSRIPTSGHSVQNQTAAWLRQNFYISYPYVIVVSDPKEKLPLIKNLGLDNFIDDKDTTILELNAGGIRTYAKLAPYNSSKPFPEGVIPVETLDEYLEKELKVGA